MKLMNILNSTACVASTILFSASLHAAPLKVYILAGQSNMQGHSEFKTLAHLKTDPATAHFHNAILDEQGKPRELERVWISYLNEGNRKFGGEITTTTVTNGRLKFGYGASGAKMGPELGFGIGAQKLFDGPILIIKCAFGGTSLHTDWRPPGAGPWTKESLTQQQLKWIESKKLAQDAWLAEQNKKSGPFYKEMIDHVRKVLEDPAKVCPEYDKAAGYEIAGFAWFQGYNDAVDRLTYDREAPGGYDLYTRLLAHFIRDVRKDLKAPGMPFVIGVLGMDGMLTAEEVAKGKGRFREAQAATASLPEFKGNVFIVQTGRFYDPELKRLDWKWGEVKSLRNKNKVKGMSNEEVAAAEKKFIAENWTAAELELHQTATSAFSYHYLGSSKFFCRTGEAFAKALTNKQDL
jgi:alpha-galactosidase